MRFLKPLGALLAILLIAACFMPWVEIASRQMIITGVDPAKSNYGKPGYMHLIFAGLFLLLTALPKLWSRRLNMFFSAFNVAWAFKNLLLMGACAYGECPVKKAALYALPILSVGMLLSVLLAPERMVPDPVDDELATA